jgi:hypothetical protein
MHPQNMKRMKKNQGVLRTDELAPDGVKIVILWNAMVINSSVFVPCIDTDLAVKDLKRITKAKGWKTVTQVRTESGKRGVRIWRTM